MRAVLRPVSEAVSTDTYLFPTWSDVVPNVLKDLPPPTISEVDFPQPPTLKTESGEGFSVTVTISVKWVEPSGIEVDMYEMWVGTRRLAEFNEADDDSGKVFHFKVRVISRFNFFFFFASISLPLSFCLSVCCLSVYIIIIIIT